MPGRISRLAIVVLVLASLVSGRAFVAAESEHVVRDGETLSSIGVSHAVPLDQLLALNELVDPNALIVGQVIKLPAPAEPSAAAPPPASSAARQTYVVRPGDTVSGIAQSFGIAVQALAEANRLTDPNRLVAGQRLAIPEGAGGTASAVAGAQAAGPAPGPSGTAAGSLAGVLDGLARRYGVDPALIRAMAGARGGLGILRVADATFDYVAREIVRRPLDRAAVEDNAEAGIAYVAALLGRAGNDPERALALFIQGSGSVQANGVLPATAQQVGAILTLRGQPAQSGPTTASG
ncbi:MAG: LysM peptidoglycan-binding domain-containing protein, partial [Chloroflexi bacterium]|nr:LysM peptidoglycan-binding domain-containing protein [Chloroflexota bacterium]